MKEAMGGGRLERGIGDFQKLEGIDDCIDR
jgi:hypothetical protein